METSWPLQPVPFADIAPGFARDLHVTPNVRSELLNRSTNVVVSALALTVLLPLIALIALAVKMTSAGPVLYVQTRVGLDRRQRRTQSYDRRHHDRGGRLFTMYKFRTMRVDAESDGRAVWAQKNDARVTPLGRILRRTRLDELPQLYNVLRGEMNIVGPRPERPSIFERLRNDIPEYTVRQRVKPGITGWAQVNQSYDCSLDDVRRKVRHDIDYVQRQGLAEDLRIMCRTVPVMLFGKGGW